MRKSEPLVRLEFRDVVVTALVKVSVLLSSRVILNDTLQSSIPECPFLVLRDFNIHLDNSSSDDFLSLIRSFDLSRTPTPPTDRAGKELDVLAWSSTDALRILLCVSQSTFSFSSL